jgi:beta-glucosidase
MNDAHGAPGRTSGRAQPRPEDNHGAHEQELLASLHLEDKVRLLTGADNWSTCPLPVIGLRPMVMSDGPAGVRGQTMDERNPSASLPCPSALGATWNPSLVRELAFALGAEAKSKGVDVLLAPTINVMRTPLGGRGFESFGEDPVLISRMAVAYVDGLRQAGVAAAAKHYVGNDSETQRWTYDARIAEHVLRELYLAPFEACVREADLDLVMTGYNMVNGVTMTEHAELLSAILKDEWGFQGVALSDWHAARSTVATAVAGLDLAMPGPAGPWGGQLTAVVRAGEVSEDEVDAKVLRILRLARRVGALGANGHAANGHPVLADPALLRRCAAAAFTLLSNEARVLPLDLSAIRSVALIGPNAVSPVTQGGGSATVPPVSVSTPADALTAALAGLDPQARVTVRPGCVTWSIVPAPELATLRDPDTGEPGVRLEFRSADGELAGTEHRTATMFTWWDGLPAGIGWGGRGTISLRARYRAAHGGPHLIGAGGVGLLTLTVDGRKVAGGHPGVPADPVEVMVRPGEVRATVDLAEGQEAEVAISLLPDDWPQGPVAIRLGIVPAPDGDALLREAVEAARDADAAIVVVGSGPATESEGFDRPGLALPGDQDELVRRVAEVNDRTVVVVNAGMPVLMPWADQVAAIGCCWLPGQAMGEALADVLLGQVEPGGRLPVTIPVAEADCPVLHSVPDQGRLEYTEGLLIGYRGYDRAGRVPRFAFGHGLGYTTWEYLSAAAGPTAVGPGRDLDLTVVVRNTGSRPGREVVQAYLEPVTAEAGRPVRTLAAFAAAVAEPGETAEVTLTVPARAFARYDETARAWAWPPGEFTVRIGRSSADLRLSVRVKSLSRTDRASPRPGNASCPSWPARLLAELDGGGEGEGGGRGARGQEKRAGFGGPALVGPVLEGALGDEDADRDRLAGVRVDRGEAGQPLGRAIDRRVRPGGIDLDDFPAATRAGVPHLHAGRDPGSAIRGAVQREGLMGPRRVADAVTEREQGFPAVAVVGAVADEQALVVGQHAVGRLGRGQSVLGRRPGHGQPAAGLGVAEQHVGERVTVLLAAEPGQQHRRRVLGPGQQDRGAGVHYHHGPGVGRDDLADQVVLAAGQGQRGAVEALALHLRGGADHDHGRVAGGGQGDGPRDLLVVGTVRRHQVELYERAELDERRGVHLVLDYHGNRLVRGQVDRGQLLRRPHQGLGDVGVLRQRQGGIEDLCPVHQQAVTAEAGDAQLVFAADGGPDHAADLQPGDRFGDPRGREPAQPQERGPVAQFRPGQLTGFGEEPDLGAGPGVERPVRPQQPGRPGLSGPQM